MTRLQNTFSWSRSRNGMFHTCARKYWLNYYGSWWGWEHGIDARTRRIYVLKQLQNRWMWAGSLVHDTIASILKELRDGRVPKPQEAEEATIDRMRQDFRNSRAGLYNERPKTCALFEHCYDETDVDWVEVRDHVSTCLRRFWESPFPETLRELAPHDWLAIEDMTHFDFEGTKTWAIPDLAYRSSDGTVWIIDWKTGRKSSEPDPVQLACYALFGSQRWGVPAESIRTVEYNLAHGTSHESSVDEERLETVRVRMRESIRTMRNLLVDPESNQANENDFPATEDRLNCQRCAFKGVCFGESWPNLPEYGVFEEVQNPS